MEAIPFDEELNNILKETREGVLIMQAHKNAYKTAVYYKKIATDVLQPDGEFTSPVIAAFDEEKKTKMKAMIAQIDEVVTPYIANMDLINNPDNTGA